VDAVLTSLFFRERPKVQQMLARWSAIGLATIAERAGRLERELLQPRRRTESRVSEAEALSEELFAIARKAKSSR